jgi:hypothetical protein
MADSNVLPQVSILSSIVVLFSIFASFTIAILVASSLSSVYGIKSDFLTQQRGQLHVSGISENSVPGKMPLSASPTIGS